MKPGELDIGDSFGLLVVMHKARDNKGHRVWKCRCHCGSITYQKYSSLKSGVVVSCGCHKRELLVKRNTSHGDHKSPEYKSWENMITRCGNPNTPYYKHYGGRGIKVCRRWKDYSNFLTDMGRKPSVSYELERIDNNKGYSPSNCRWATRKEQMANRRITRHITVKGITKTMMEWSLVTGVGCKTIEYRMNAGWSEDRLLSKPQKRKRK